MTDKLPKTTGLVETFIKGIDRRLKLLEENIGSATDAVLRFLSIKEDIEVTDTVYIYKRDVNDSFLLGTSKVGVDRLGDRRSAEVLLWSGG
jgi:hypothetical protein